MKNFIKRYFLLLVIVCFLLIYWITGVRLCTVESGSMEPTIPTGSLCIVNSHIDYEDIELGDVVVYVRASDGKRIIHRVIAITEEGMITKGDANSIDDGLSVTRENLYAKELLYIPYVGRLSMAVRTPAIRYIVIAAVVALIVWDIFGGEKKEEEDAEKKD